jgi:DNA topoisomerase-1
MGKKLVIVESPGKLKTIQKILGSDYIVRATMGHICDLRKSVGQDLGIDIKNGFKPKYEVVAEKRDKIKAIIDSAKMCDEVYVASDADREGECIAFHVAEQLADIKKPMHRIAFQEITKPALNYAIANPVGFNHNLYDAQQARRVLDRIVGFMVSPYISTKLHDKLSAGRVQSVALRMIVDREREIESFIPDVYFNVSVSLTKDGKKFVAKYPSRIDSEEIANKLVEDLNNSTYTVTDIQTKQNLRKPAPPLTTSVLQQDAYTKLKYKPDKTMKIAQELYEAGHITYLRTDSVTVSVEALNEVREYLTKNKYKIPKAPNTYQNKDAAQEAHEAIRPTHIEQHPDKIPLTEEQLKLYNLIWRTFVASQMEPAVFDVVKVTIKAGTHELLAEGKIQREEGWMEIMKPFLKKDKDIVLPNLSISNSLLKDKVLSEKSQTKPPARYNEGSLITELERKEIGRPSTFATIINKISSRQYVKQTAAGFESTDIGKTLVDNLKDDFSFMDYLYTANMEKKLDDISAGKLEYIPMMTEFFEGFKVEFQRARGAQGMATGIPCPKCGGETVVRKSKYGFFAGCIKYKTGCDGIVSIDVTEDNKIIEKPQEQKIDLNIKCPECGEGMVLRPDGKFGPFYSCSRYPRCYGKRKVPFGKKCPDCGNELYATLFKDELKLACMGYPACRHIEDLPDDAKVRWLNYKEMTPPEYGRRVEKVLKKTNEATGTRETDSETKSV